MRVLIECTNIDNGQETYVYDDNITKYAKLDEGRTIIDVYDEKYEIKINIDTLIARIQLAKKTFEELPVIRHNMEDIEKLKEFMNTLYGLNLKEKDQNDEK